MKKEYKELFNEIVPGDDIKKKVISMAENKKRLMFSPKKIIAAVAVFAVAAQAVSAFIMFHLAGILIPAIRNPHPPQVIFQSLLMRRIIRITS